MTPEMKQSLEQVVVAMANEQTADAKAAFSQYLRMKTRSILLGEKEDMDDEKDEDCDDEDEADEGDDDKKSKKGKKDDKDDEKDED